MIIIVQIWLIVIAPGDPARFLLQVISAFQPICRVLFKNFSRRIEHALNLSIFSRILYSFHCILFCLLGWLIHSVAFSFINLLILLIQILQWFIRFLHTNKTKEYFIACISFFLSLSLQFSLLIHVLRLSDLTNNFIHKKLDIYCIVKGVPYTMCIARWVRFTSIINCRRVVPCKCFTKRWACRRQCNFNCLPNR